MEGGPQKESPMAAEFGTILIDVSPGTDIEVDRSFLERLGHPVTVCHGPPHGHLCPILAGTGCPMAEEAHGVVFELDLDRPQHRAILRRYREVLAEDIPIRAVVEPGQETRYADTLAGIGVWTREPTTGDLDAFASEVEAYERLAT
jgi:hypothetical protein